MKKLSKHSNNDKLNINRLPNLETFLTYLNILIYKNVMQDYNAFLQMKLVLPETIIKVFIHNTGKYRQ